MLRLMLPRLPQKARLIATGPRLAAGEQRAHHRRVESHGTINMAIYFEQGSGTEAGGDTIQFRGTDGDLPFRGVITREALEDLWSPARPAARWTDMFETLERQVFNIAEAKVKAGRLQSDGTVLITANDLCLI